MKLKERSVLICDCEGTMPLDGAAVAKAIGAAGEPWVATQLCRAQLGEFEKVARGGSSLLVACTQEAPLFLEALGETETPADARFTNIRERAGWSKDAKNATPKIAALLAEAAVDVPPTPAVTMTSKGVLLVLGDDERAIDAARQVASRLEVTVIVTGDAEIAPPRVMDVPVFKGRIKSAEGRLGAFQIAIEGFAPALPSSRDVLRFERDGKIGTSVADLVLDLRSAPPLFSAWKKRDGYFRPDAGDPAQVQKALLDLTDMVGAFEKPRYVDYDASLCAHARSKIVGCTRCLDHCPTGAIAPDGDSVKIDAFICAGCGTCASVCPTGAATYGVPAADGLYQRLRALLGTYLKAGGTRPALLVHDPRHGDPMIDALARFGDGLPADVLPFAVNEVTQIGVDFLLVAAGYGADRVIAVVPPTLREEGDALRREIELANTVLAGLGFGDRRFSVADDADPDALSGRFGPPSEAVALPYGDFLAVGRKRAVMKLALQHLHKHAPTPADSIPLAAGAPFGAVDINVAGCTLCLACVGACPTGALKDNPNKPQLSFAEESCVQCGLCKNTCPEKVISLVPRLSFLEAAYTHQVVKEEEPFLCVRCGKAFGTKASIERMIGKLQGHSMFSGGAALDRLRMCETCRVVAMMEDQGHPFAGAPRPAIRTTEDYLQEREEMRKAAAADMTAKGLKKGESA
ncbi:MAG: 4Fe-4S dicluster domain-containing protein [Rhodospirillales bacterium]|nr:4Fe-4S dicluster domain-containing protein [Rhodospirillales bacterium]